MVSFYKTRIIIFLLLISFPLLKLSAGGHQAQVASPAGHYHADGGEPGVYFSFRCADKDQIAVLSKLISIDNVADGIVWAYAGKEAFEVFRALQIPYTILPYHEEGQADKILELSDLGLPLAWDFYPSYPAYETMMAGFETSYPALCRIVTIGTLSSGRKLLAAHLSSNVDSSMNKPQFFYLSSLHGNELTMYVLMLRLIDTLLANYGTNPRMTAILDNIDVWICPLGNPDGTYHVSNNSVNGAVRENANGVDLNRNFPDPEDGPHPDGNAWQEETVFYMSFADEHHFVMSANFHGGAEVVNYPWDTWAILPADDLWWNFVGRQFADTIHLYGPSSYFNDLDNGVTNGYAWYSIDGGWQDYMNWWHHCREATIEVSSTKKPPASQLPTYWNYLRRSLLNYLEQSTYGIRGIVTDSITGAPLRARVFIQGHDFDSSFIYSSLPVGNYHRLLFPGSYNLTFTAPGYYPKTLSGLSVVHYQANVQDVQLVPIGTGTMEPDRRSITVFPNPAGQYLNFYWPEGTPVEKLSIYNMLGEKVLEMTPEPTGNNLQSIAVSALQAGAYYLEIRTFNNTAATAKFIRQ
ncbi:MAG TPA: M14 family zinc carboxypeptidase [Bacteroidales bacterium]|nr:M14 family zinc carboxypeptidase [Bacteroidales bacterium]HSA42692.1 M14 family zinc carboxypeptidase [Bacteroidales bacterium]